MKARPINGTFGVQVEDVRLPDLTDAQFAKKFEDLVQKQYAWLSEHGVHVGIQSLIA